MKDFSNKSVSRKRQHNNDWFFVSLLFYQDKMTHTAQKDCRHVAEYFH